MKSKLNCRSQRERNLCSRLPMWGWECTQSYLHLKYVCWDMLEYSHCWACSIRHMLEHMWTCGCNSKWVWRSSRWLLVGLKSQSILPLLRIHWYFHHRRDIGTYFILFSKMPKWILRLFWFGIQSNQIPIRMISSPIHLWSILQLDLARLLYLRFSLLKANGSVSWTGWFVQTKVFRRKKPIW